MQAQPLNLSQLRAELIRLGFERLEAGQLKAQVPEGPGYHDTVQPLIARQEAASAAYEATQKQIAALMRGAQPSLF